MTILFAQLIRKYHWELVLLLLTIVAAVWSANVSPYYLSFDQISYSLQQSMAITGLLAIGLALIIVTGEIDISLPAMLAIGTILFARFSEFGVPVFVAIPLVLLVTTAAGMLNGFLVVAFGLPSLAVTLGTTAVFRGFALLFGGQQGYASFDQAYIWLGSEYIANIFPVSLAFLLLVFVGFVFLMHGTVYGRLVYAVGNNMTAARFSGVRIPAIKISAFGIGGLLAGLAALVYVGQFESARADNASEILLFVVAAVVLGGFDIFGGRGNAVGLFFSLILLGTIKNGMGLANLAGPVQTLIVGSLLVGSVLIPSVARRYGRSLTLFSRRFKASEEDAG